MRWSFVVCLLLVSAALARPRPKRSLGYIKNLIVNKLFGSKTVVIARPILTNPSNQTYQLFKVPGYDDIVIKVTRKTDIKDKVKPVKEDAVIVNPEVAIIGSYLGTTTQKETLLAIEMVKSLLNSGVLSGVRSTSVQELMVPMNQRPHMQYYEEQAVPLNVFREQGVFVPVTQQDTRNVFPIALDYPLIATEVNPGQSKYFYKQKGPETDMTYESYNNGDVMVTRTEKEPPLPQFIKVRLAEVATIGANPYTASYFIKNGPVPVQYYVNPGMMVTENVQGSYLQPNALGNGVPHMQRILLCKEKVSKLCPLENNQVKNSDKNTAPIILNKSNQLQGSVVSNQANNIIKGESNAHRIAVNEFLKNHSVNGQLMSQYVYKQMNHHSRDNYTEVKVGVPPQLSADMTSGVNVDLHKDYVYIPPKNVDSSMLNALSLHNQAVTDIGQKQDDKNAFLSKVKSNEVKQYVPSLFTFSNENKNGQTFEKQPIVVPEPLASKDIENHTTMENARFNEAVKTISHINENKRGDIPGATY